MSCSLYTCFTDLGWPFWKSPGLLTLDLCSTLYLDCHVQSPGLIMFSPFLCRNGEKISVPLGFWGFWHSDTLCTAVRKDLEAGALK